MKWTPTHLSIVVLPQTSMIVLKWISCSPNKSNLQNCLVDRRARVHISLAILYTLKITKFSCAKSSSIHSPNEECTFSFVTETGTSVQWKRSDPSTISRSCLMKCTYFKLYVDVLNQPLRLVVNETWYKLLFFMLVWEIYDRMRWQVQMDFGCLVLNYRVSFQDYKYLHNSDQFWHQWNITCAMITIGHDQMYKVDISREMSDIASFNIIPIKVRS